MLLAQCLLRLALSGRPARDGRGARNRTSLRLLTGVGKGHQKCKRSAPYGPGAVHYVTNDDTADRSDGVAAKNARRAAHQGEANFGSAPLGAGSPRRPLSRRESPALHAAF